MYLVDAALISKWFIWLSILLFAFEMTISIFIEDAVALQSSVSQLLVINRLRWITKNVFMLHFFRPFRFHKFFSGCIRELIVNNFKYILDQDSSNLTKQRHEDGSLVQRSGANIEDCDGNLCGFHSCKNNGKCLETQSESEI